MADKKISQLTALSAANLAPSTDVLAIVDTSATETKKIVAQDLINGVLNVASAVGIGTASPGYKLDVVGTTRVAETAAQNGYEVAPGATNIITSYNRTTSTWLPLRQRANKHEFYCDGVETLTLTSSGNLGLGVTPSGSWFTGSKVFQFGATGAAWNNGSNNTAISHNAIFGNSTNTYITSSAASYYRQFNGQHNWFISTDVTPTAGNTITFTQAMTLTATGQLELTAAAPRLAITPATGTNSAFVSFTSSAGANGSYVGIDSSASGLGIGGYSMALWHGANYPLVFGTNNTERASITSDGAFCVGNTTAFSFNNSNTGAYITGPGVGAFSPSGDAGLYVNRVSSDGNLVRFYQDGTEEGNISVSGNTVSYNAFAGSHWSQLQDGSKPDILRGTVMESINELCVWPDENNERLPKSKVSDTAGSKKVYGVFMAWDNDWTETNDMYVTAVGAFICRVNGSVTVQEGDLLESNGDGTARVQADDIIRSSTIGKVTSTVKTHQYDDGSYCVPTVLYCG
jgi:hypothetical protein